MRASGTDEAVVLVPPIRMTLEQALEFIDDDELVEVTPTSIRIRKRHLTENDVAAPTAHRKTINFVFLLKNPPSLVFFYLSSAHQCEYLFISLGLRQ